MKVAFDMNSILWTALLAGVDPEHIEVFDPEENKKVKVNTAAYGYENAVNSINYSLGYLSATPLDMLMVFEGMNSKARRLFIDRDYKSKRGKRVPEQLFQFQELKQKIAETFQKLGACIVRQDNVEADDVLAALATNFEHDLAIVSNDSDLAALHGKNAHGAMIRCVIRKNEDNPYGPFPHGAITVYKALVGDTADSITGVKGFGKETWIKFDAAFGEDGMKELARLGELGSLLELEEEAEQHKLIKMIYEGRDDFLRSYKLAKMYPEWVDTMSDPLEWMPGLVQGAVNDERLQQWQATRSLVTSSNFDKFFARFEATLNAANRDWLSLDIETSTPDESDEWLAAQEDPEGVDVIGSELTGMSLTFGSNMQHTVYMPLNHTDTDNLTIDQIEAVVNVITKLGLKIVIQNVQFEGTVLYGIWGAKWKDNGYQGLLPNWLDTKIEASYVNEDEPTGLKKLAKRWFNYDQVEYKTVTNIDGVQYKMRELPAKHVFDYACDDTVVTASFHNFAQSFMAFERTWAIYEKVEIAASYLHCQSFIRGTKVSLSRLSELSAEDDAVYDENWGILRDFLISKGWEGSVCPVYTQLTPNIIKDAYEIVTGVRPSFTVRVWEKVAAAMPDHPLKALIVHAHTTGDFGPMNDLVKLHFAGEPDFNIDSSNQKCKLLYEMLELPIRVRNKVTKEMKSAGQKVGNPKADALAITYAMVDAAPELKPVLNALRLMQMVGTRRKLYYRPYPYFVHWKTGRVHSSHNQCATNTRRASSSKPNVQQVSKNQKVEGFSPKIREVFIPHKKNAVLVSMDFMAQELRVIADYSQDPGMVACFVGDSPKDMHAMTGLGIYNSRNATSMAYDEYIGALNDRDNPLHKEIKKTRGTGKQVNFTTEYGAMAPKLAMTLLVSEEEAQTYLEAKEAAFPVASAWKKTVIAEALAKGYVTTKLGARRHLREALCSRDRSVSSKAERQAVNFKIQGSSAEMTKLAEGRMWEAQLTARFDCEIVAPIHDEVLASVAIEDLYDFIPAMHACMIVPYADMQIPVMSSISFGRSFGPAHQIEIGDSPTKEAIDSGLAQMEAA